MTPRTRLVLAIFGLVSFIGLAITMLVIGENVTAISSLIPVIVLAVVHLLQGFDGRIRPTSTRTPLRSVQNDAEDEHDEERPAA
ncbi:hypothetical protein ACGFWE_43185 [Streptomyces sp. NPDC048523]|uniref:hypothetical protein n=1 Tax=Streptomyces sp. NPDC048523 TaxID=3365567 RepID=UPI00371094AF